MHLKIRYSCLFLFLFWLLYLLYIWNQRMYKTKDNHTFDFDYEYMMSPQENLTSLLSPVNNSQTCDEKQCLNYTRCINSFKIYIYPHTLDVFPVYQNILNILAQSHYVTNDPSMACIFIPSLDTLDRDILSPKYYKITPKEITENAIYWNGGVNHVFFNLYSGTYPNYKNKLDFDIGNAILVNPNLEKDSYRKHNDLTIPLVNDKYLNDYYNHTNEIIISNRKNYLLGFKGKRYVYGIGSETRNLLYHLHNDDDIILLTTCKHGTDWNAYKDDRCDQDNKLFEQYDYLELLVSSTFCLVPRGRRLASYRFLEVLSTSCIPVVVSDNWVLPFSEVIDWSRAAIQFEEGNIFMLSDYLYSLTKAQIEGMRNQVIAIYLNYFTSFRDIIETILEILKDRMKPELARPPIVWNTRPGALHVDFEYSNQIGDFPFYTTIVKDFHPKEKYFLSIYVDTHDLDYLRNNLARLLKECSKSRNVSKIILIWNTPLRQFSVANLINADLDIPVIYYTPTYKDRGRAKFGYAKEIYTIESDAIFLLSLEDNVTVQYLDKAFHVWKSYPESIVGYRGYAHTYNLNSLEQNDYDQDKIQPIYYMLDMELSNQYSVISTSLCIYHKYYNYLYSTRLTRASHDLVAHYSRNLIGDDDIGRNVSIFVEDLPFNFLISSILNTAPIKIGYLDFLSSSSAEAAGRIRPNFIGQLPSNQSNFSENYETLASKWQDGQKTLLQQAFKDMQAGRYFKPEELPEDYLVIEKTTFEDRPIPPRDFPDMPLTQTPPLKYAEDENLFNLD